MNDSEIIDRLGGTSKVAEMCGLTTGAISQWRHKGIPKPWMLFFRAEHPTVFEGAGVEKDRRHTDRRAADRRRRGDKEAA